MCVCVGGGGGGGGLFVASHLCTGVYLGVSACLCEDVHIHVDVHQ